MREIKEEKNIIASHHLPPWLRKRLKETEQVIRLKKILREKKLHTVCQSAGCPNINECFQKPTATFMILGNVCTRHCRFCGIPKGVPQPVDPDEGRRIGDVVAALGLKHVVITSVTRDDLADGGATQFAETIKYIHKFSPNSSVEALIPDFMGEGKSLQIVLDSGLDILNHNVETVPRLYNEIRPEADFERSLRVLEKAKTLFPDVITKSGIMVGLGETYQEVLDVFGRLHDAGCDALTIGQYLNPNLHSYPVKEYVLPETFAEYKQAALSRGIHWVNSGPYVRSSFNAEELMKNVEELGSE